MPSLKSFFVCFLNMTPYGYEEFVSTRGWSNPSGHHAERILHPA